MASIQEHYSKVIRHYENAISIQDRLIEHNRQCGLPIENGRRISEPLTRRFECCATHT